jgi:hypothetical protein
VVQRSIRRAFQLADIVLSSRQIVLPSYLGSLCAAT